MAGFGTGPFGGSGFGSAPWVNLQLWESIPYVYRAEDALQVTPPDPLSRFVFAVGDELNRLSALTRDFVHLRNPDRVPTSYDNSQRLRLGAIIQQLNPIERRGYDGTLVGATPGADFEAASARFTTLDIGKEITLSRSAVASNNRTVTIIGIVSATRVSVTGNLIISGTETLRWDLRQPKERSVESAFVEVLEGSLEDVRPGWVMNTGKGRFNILSRRRFTDPELANELLTAREGRDGYFQNGYFKSSSALFSTQDIGRELNLSNASNVENNGRWVITDVIDAETASITRTLLRGADSDGGVVYEINEYDSLGRQVAVSHVVSGIGTALAKTEDTAARTVTINLATDNAGVVTSTSADVAALFSAGSLLSATATGSTGGLAAAGTASVPGFKFTANATTQVEWAVFRRGVLEVDTPGVVEGALEQSGVDMETSTTTRLKSVSASFSADDVGKVIVVKGSPDASGNNGVYSITSLVDANTVAINKTVSSGETGLTWSLHSSTSLGDGAQVDLAPPSLIKYLARDFGITLNEKLPEQAQRSWTSNVHKYLNQKGVTAGYNSTTALNGYAATTRQLYHITAAMTSVVPAANMFEVGSTAAGHSGTDGSLFLHTSGRLRFTAPTALFDASHGSGGFILKIEAAATAGNNQYYSIESVVDAQTVEFIATDAAASLPDGNDGSLHWFIIRLFTDLAPLRPRFDEINTDVMEDHVDTIDPGNPTKEFRADMFCWETKFYAEVDITVSSTMAIVTDKWEVSITVGALAINLENLINPPPPAASSTQPLGVWKLTDSAGTEFFLETIVSGTNPNYTFEVVATAAPATGAGTIEYVCPIDITCDYCPAAGVLISLERLNPSPTTEVPDSVTWNDILRDLRQVTPAHVSVYTLIKGMEDTSLVWSEELPVMAVVPPGLHGVEGDSLVDIQSVVIA